MAMPLLTTKLYIPPVRPLRSVVPRPILIERLNEGLRMGRKLTLISAPAGFGKTTLVSEWIHAGVSSREYGERGEHEPTGEIPPTLYSILPTPRFAWLSLDEGDNDPTRFLTYVIAALQTIEASIGQGALRSLQSPQPPPAETILTALINEIADLPDHPAAGSGQGLVLVLDDYHLIEAQPIHDALAFLLEHLPLQVHLAIASREDSHLPLARLRARGQLTEVRAADLRFTSFEAAEFLNRVMGLDLSAEDIAALEKRTEGWIAGLQLAAISMQGREDTSSLVQSFTGSHRFVLDYLIEEVLEQQSESVQTFLLQTAILDRLTGSLCDAVTGQDNGRATLEMLDRSNLFIVPLDNERHWYRYHHLFADLLRQRLRQTQPEQAPTLHCRASDWYEQNGFQEKAIEHSIRGEDFKRSAMLLEEQADVIWGRGEHNKLFRWLERLPNEALLSKPQLYVYNAWYQFINGQQDAAEQSLLAAEKALNQSVELAAETAPTKHDPRNDSSWMQVLGRIATIRAEMALYRGDLQEIYKNSQLALEYLPEQDLPWRSAATAALGDAYGLLGELEQAYRVRLEAVQLSRAGKNHYLMLISIMKLTSTLRQQGRLNQIVEIFQQQLQLANESGMSQTDVFGCILAIWGEVLAEFSDLEGAIDLARKGVELAERGRDVAIIGWSYLSLMRVLFSRGDFASAEEIYQKTERINRELFMPPWIRNQMAAWQTRIWLAQGKLDISSQWALERGLNIDGELTYLRVTEYFVLARLLIAQERLDETCKLLERLCDAAKAGGRTAKLIEILILQALAFQARDDTESAITTLGKAITLAESEGFVCIFVDEGPPMARLLYKALARGIAPEYVQRLLAAFPDVETEQASPLSAQTREPDLIEPLSERELEVLQLIAEGLTNQEIADRLYLALNTVKVHTRNINGKLGVHSRTQAVARARVLGVLPAT